MKIYWYKPERKYRTGSSRMIRRQTSPWVGQTQLRTMMAKEDERGDERISKELDIRFGSAMRRTPSIGARQKRGRFNRQPTGSGPPEEHLLAFGNVSIVTGLKQANVCRNDDNN